MPFLGLDISLRDTQMKHNLFSLIILIACAPLFLAGANSLHSDAQLFHKSEGTLLAFSRASGYCISQGKWLDHIADKYPDLASRAQLAQAEFELAFPEACKFMLTFVASAMKTTVEAFESTLLDAMQVKSKEILPGDDSIPRDQAIEFIATVLSRGKGNVESPVFELLLATSSTTRRSPASELSRGFFQPFNTKGHAKSLGASVKMRIPRSWVAKEGDRPHVVQKWVEGAGFGRGIVLLMVMEPDSEAQIEWKVQLDRPDACKVLFGGAHLTNISRARWFSIDGLPTVACEYEQTSTTAFGAIAMRSVSMMTFVENTPVVVQCSVSALASESIDVPAMFSRISMLCNAISTQIVFPAQYTSN